MPERQLVGRGEREVVVLAEVTREVTGGPAEAGDPGARLEVIERFLLDGIGRSRRTERPVVDLAVGQQAKFAVDVSAHLADAFPPGL